MSIAYQGDGHVVSQDDAARTATLEAEGRETGGSGTARAVVGVSVDEGDHGAEVTLVIELAIVGRASQVGQGGLAEVARGLVAQTATCITARLTEPQIPLPIPILAAEREERPSAVDRALAIARDRPVALATAGGAAAAAVVVAVLLRVRGAAASAGYLRAVRRGSVGEAAAQLVEGVDVVGGEEVVAVGERRRHPPRLGGVAPRSRAGG